MAKIIDLNKRLENRVAEILRQIEENSKKIRRIKALEVRLSEESSKLAKEFKRLCPHCKPMHGESLDACSHPTRGILPDGHHICAGFVCPIWKVR